MKSYLIFGTRFCGADKFAEWILDCSDNVVIRYSSVKNHTKDKYDKVNHDVATEYFIFTETSLVYHEDLMLSHNTTNYTKTIILFRDMYDVIDDILSRTFKETDAIIDFQSELLEEFVDEYEGEANRIPPGYSVFVNYTKWLTDIDYRNKIAMYIGIENNDYETYLEVQNIRLRDKIRYRKYFTTRLKTLNSKIK